MLDLYQELSAFLRALEQEGTPYALCGGLAMAVWGKPRATLDIDVLIPEDAFARAREAARRCGYVFDAAPMTFAGGAVRIRRVTKTDPDTGEVLPIDFLLLTPAIEAAFSTRERVAWDDGHLWVVSRGGMILLKQLRGSGQDRDDIEALREDDT